MVGISCAGSLENNISEDFSDSNEFEFLSVFEVISLESQCNRKNMNSE